MAKKCVDVLIVVLIVLIVVVDATTTEFCTLPPIPPGLHYQISGIGKLAQYPDFGTIAVDLEEKIDYNAKYSYLYYEYDTPAIVQIMEEEVVSRFDLDSLWYRSVVNENPLLCSTTLPDGPIRYILDGFYNEDESVQTPTSWCSGANFSRYLGNGIYNAQEVDIYWVVYYTTLVLDILRENEYYWYFIRDTDICVGISADCWAVWERDTPTPLELNLLIDMNITFWETGIQFPPSQFSIWSNCSEYDTYTLPDPGPPSWYVSDTHYPVTCPIWEVPTNKTSLIIPSSFSSDIYLWKDHIFFFLTIGIPVILIVGFIVCGVILGVRIRRRITRLKSKAKPNLPMEMLDTFDENQFRTVVLVDEEHEGIDHYNFGTAQFGSVDSFNTDGTVTLEDGTVLGSSGPLDYLNHTSLSLGSFDSSENQCFPDMKLQRQTLFTLPPPPCASPARLAGRANTPAPPPLIPTPCATPSASPVPPPSPPPIHNRHSPRIHEPVPPPSSPPIHSRHSPRIHESTPPVHVNPVHPTILHHSSSVPECTTPVLLPTPVASPAPPTTAESKSHT